MIAQSLLQPRKLIIIGFILPYILIILMTGFIMIPPGLSTGDGIKRVGAMVFWFPFITAFGGSILVGIGNVKRAKAISSHKSSINAFIFGFFWAAVFHFFITLYFFMQIIYTYSGLMP